MLNEVGPGFGPGLATIPRWVQQKPLVRAGVPPGCLNENVLSKRSMTADSAYALLLLRLKGCMPHKPVRPVTVAP